MDPENQDRIKALVDEHGADDFVVVLGAADLEALEVAAETVTLGRSGLRGSVGRSPVGAPCRAHSRGGREGAGRSAIYDEQVGLLEMTLDLETVRGAMTKLKG